MTTGSLSGRSAMSFSGHAEADPWTAETYAPKWFKDALQEASRNEIDSRRREIVFALATAESYLLEWVRDDLLKRDFDRLSNFFPPRERSGVMDRFAKVLSDLHAAGLIHQEPSFMAPVWDRFRTLIDYRNGLLHANASRPHLRRKRSTSQPVQPLPSSNQLKNYRPGCAVGVVMEVICELHSLSRTPVPSWLP